MTSTSSARSRSPRARPQRRRRGPSPPRELREAGIAARKSLGQHFLVSTSTLRRVADACGLTPRYTAIEIGAGLGGLTAELSSRAGRVIAIELDDTLAPYLQRRFAHTNVFVVHGDALALDPANLLASAGASGPHVVAGNLPYNVAQPLLRHYLEAPTKPERLVVMVQAEVAESIAAKPGEMTLLACSVQLYGEPRLLFRVRPSAFYPPPKVRSAVVRIDVAPRLRAGVEDVDAFFRVVRSGFSTKRKQLRNSLANGLRVDAPIAAELLAAARIDATRRAQDLSLDQWAALARTWVACGQPEGAA